jgi:hypothetical protein
LLQTLRDQWMKRTQLRFHARLLDLQIGSIESGGGNWFFHDDLGPFFELFSVSEFERELEPYGLQFASEALFENLIPEALPDASADDWIGREQTWDNLNFRGFRSTLVCHRGQRLERPAELEAFERLRYAAPLTRVSATVFRNDWTESEAESQDAGTLRTLECLAEKWPASLAFEELRTEAAVLRELTLAGLVEPRVSQHRLPHPPETIAMSETPAVFSPARLQARRGNMVTNRLHAAIQLEQEPLRRFVIGLDGVRPLSELLPLFGNERDLIEQLRWLYRAALIQ